MIYTQNPDCGKWQFENLPEYDKGKLSPLFADCGTGTDDGGDGSSFMHTVKETDAGSIRDYAEGLSSAGFKKRFENTKDGNLFYQFETGDGFLYISYLAGTRTARFILDNKRCTPLDRFGTVKYETVREDTAFTQSSLHYDAMIRGTTSDCGMNYIFRLRDNSLIIIDGGEFEQSTDIAADDYMKLLRSLTNTAENEKMRVALYLCTHAHNDHCDFFSKLIRFHSDELCVEKAAFNFPKPENVRNSPSCALLKERLAAAYPGYEYVKLHAGMKFTIANAEIEILVSAEDAVDTDPEEIFHGTNDSSTIFTVTADGRKCLFLADCAWDIGDALINNYSDETLSADFLQAAHHGINSIEEVYDRISAKTVLLPQCRMNMNTRFEEILKNLCRRYGEENILFAHDKTDIFTFNEKTLTHAERKHIGCAYDGSEW